MAYQQADDYIDVASRIVAFRDKHPEGALQPLDLAKPYTIEVIDGQTYIVVVAAAYRTPDDLRPGVGMAYEQFPGKTPYTRASELQNAETAAWGRAIVAALAGDTKRGIASAEEVRNRQAEHDVPPSVARQQARSENRRAPARTPAEEAMAARNGSPGPDATAWETPLTVEQVAAMGLDQLRAAWVDVDKRHMLDHVVEVPGPVAEALVMFSTSTQWRLLLNGLVEFVKANGVPVSETLKASQP